jgi:UDP-N-acetylglucosamine--N-acetylmuramyl-(pentapeptide) pyrophosphoryl-undecaprenol N-acetylglucosamine transferase
VIGQLKSLSLVFAGGGTGGHFFPAVAIADRVCELAGDSCEKKIAFVGTTRGIEYRLHDTLGYPLHVISVRGLERAFTLKNVAVPVLALRSLWQSRMLLKRVVPELVVGTGGYVSWPVLRMAAMMKIPVVLQEQNSYPGVATRQLARFAARVYLGYDEARQYLPNQTPLVLTGNPVRRQIATGNRAEALRHFKLEPSRRTILVLGGSQGARAINDAVLRSFENRPLSESYQLLWQTGMNDYAEVMRRLGGSADRHAVFLFEQRMDLVYAAADMVIARAGAISLAEIESVVLPALLVPYPQAAGDHQRKNAQAAGSRGFAEVVDPVRLAGTDLLGLAVAMCEDGRVDAMKQRLRQHVAGRKPAVDVIAEDIIRLVIKAQEARLGRSALGS